MVDLLSHTLYTLAADGARRHRATQLDNSLRIRRSGSRAEQVQIFAIRIRKCHRLPVPRILLACALFQRGPCRACRSCVAKVLVFPCAKWNTHGLDESNERLKPCRRWALVLALFSWVLIVAEKKESRFFEEDQLANNYTDRPTCSHVHLPAFLPACLTGCHLEGE
jgi:hypothetical protein